MRILSLHDFLANGSSNMGDRTTPESICRFKLNAGLWLPIRVLATFASGTGTATMSMYLDANPRDDLHNHLLAQWLQAGTDGKANIFWRPPTDEQEAFVVQPPMGDPVASTAPEIVFEWTNPDDGTMTWELMVRLGEVSLA